MHEYTGFAKVYDEFMDDIPYDEWTSRLVELLRQYGVDDGLVLELGCGTGNITTRLSDAGYDMIGVDSSAEMLLLAREKSEGKDILYLEQDMQEFELYGTVRAAVSLCDSINYIMDEEDLVQVFKLVNNYLDPGGVFIFDIKTEHFYKDVLGDRVMCDNRDEACLVWENYYDEQENVNEYDLTIFCNAASAGSDGSELYRKFEETHCQRVYGIDDINRALKLSGMKPVGVFNAYDGSKISEKSERVYFVALECGK